MYIIIIKSVDGPNFMYLLAHIEFGVVPTLTVKREMGQLHLHVYFIALFSENISHTKMIHDRVLFLFFGSQKLTALEFCLAWYKQSVIKTNQSIYTAKEYQSSIKL